MNSLGRAPSQRFYGELDDPDEDLTPRAGVISSLVSAFSSTSIPAFFPHDRGC